LTPPAPTLQQENSSSWQNIGQGTREPANRSTRWSYHLVLLVFALPYYFFAWRRLIVDGRTTLAKT
jgi:hypothetical protein